MFLILIFRNELPYVPIVAAMSSISAEQYSRTAVRKKSPFLSTRASRFRLLISLRI